jgi:hypothetical protein
MRVVGAMAWGGDPRKMDHALATYSSEFLGMMREVSPLPATPPDLETLSRRLGLRPDELARMPGSAAFYGSFYGDPHGTSRELWRTVFDPAGHFRAVADAPGRDRLVQDFARAIQGGAFFAGVLLLLVARLAQRHPEVGASLNRAVSVMQGWSARGVMKVPSDKTLFSAWTEWRHLAPLWAAFGAEFQQVRALGFAPFAAGLETLHDPVRLRQTIRHAKWFRSFAVSFSSKRNGDPLIPPGEALQIIADVEALEPDLPPLPPDDLAAAKAHRAPTRKGAVADVVGNGGGVVSGLFNEP